MPGIDEQQLASRRKLLEALQAQSLQGTPSQMVSGRVVPQGMGEGITRLLQAYMTSKGLGDVSQQEKALEDKSKAGQSAATQKIIEAMTGRPQTGGPLRGQDYQPVQPAIPGDPQKAAIMAATNPHTKDNQALQGVTQAMLRGQGGRRSNPYFQFLPTKEGYVVGDARTGDISKPDDSFVRSQDDPELQGDITGSKETGKLESQLKLKPKVDAAIETAKSVAARQHSMSGIGGLISEADNILANESPTGSGVGAAADYLGGIVGVSPEGATQSAQLKAIGGALVSKMPRMEGPQSDRDVVIYKEMAGKVGDPTIPIDQRRAALDTVKEIWGKYDHLNEGDSPDVSTAYDAEKEKRYQEWKARQ